MGIKTGRPRGRPPGAKSKRTEAREQALQAAAARINDAIPEAFTGDSHDLLMMVYKDPNRPIDVRIDAAKTAIGYEKPRLQAIEQNIQISEHEEAVRTLHAVVVTATDEHERPN